MLASVVASVAAASKDNVLVSDELTVFMKTFIPRTRWAIPLFMCAVFTPSPTVLYVAAGVSAGNTVIETDVGQKALDVIMKKLNDELGTGG